MVSLKHLYKDAIAEGPQYPKMVIGPHTRWLERPEINQIYSEEAIQHVVRVLRGKAKKQRSGRFSPSALGECRRRVLFGWAGVDQVGEDPDVLDLMGLGSWGHLRWQAEGISAGWMQRGEVWVMDREYPMGGTMDGILADGSIFELKTVHEFVFSKIVDQLNEPKYNHLLQIHAYMRMSRRDMASLVYEARSTGQYHEYRVKRDPDISRAVREEIELLTEHTVDGTLPPMIDECVKHTGTVFKRCPYRKHCPSASRLAA